MTTVMERRYEWRDTAANWAAANPVANAGQWMYDTTNNAWKSGDGATAWSTLKYSVPPTLSITAGGPTGSASVVPVITYDAYGRITAVTTATITPAAIGAVPTSRLLNTTAPLTGGGDHTADRTLAISAATTSAAGSMSAADKTALDAIGSSGRVFRPAAYGTVDPTGAADSTTAFTAMMTAYNAFNDRAMVEMPIGVFKVNTAVIAFTTTAPQAFIGRDRGICVLVPNSGTGDMVKFGAGADGCSIQGVTIFQTGSPSTAGAAINTNGANDVLIDNVSFNNMFNDVLVGGSSIKVDIAHTTHSQTNGSATSVGILVSNGAAGDTYIGPDVVMSNTGATRRRACVEVTQSGHFEINQANLTGSAQGLLVDPPAGQIVADGFINESLFDSNTVNGVTLNATTATSTIKSLHFTASWFSGTVTGTGGAGFVTTGTAGGIINGIELTACRALNNQTHGYQHGFGTDVRWVGGRASGNSAASSNVSDGINIAAAVSNWSINGGKYGGTDGAPTGGNQRYGIAVAAGASDNFTIVGPDCLGNNTGPFLNGATGLNQYVVGVIGMAQPKSLAANAAIANTETQVLGINVPANSQRVATAYAIEGGGLWSNTAVATTSTLRIRFGTTTLTGNIPQGITINCGATARTNVPFNFTGRVTVKSVGAGGTVTGYLVINLPNVVAPIIAAVSTAAVALDTTAVKILEVTYISGLVGNTVTFTDCTIKPEVA